MEQKIVDNEAVLEGNCPVCGKVIRFSVENNFLIRQNQVAGQVYEWFLNNNELCFECRMLFEGWVKEHKSYCIANNISYREVANKYLEKAGKEQVVGINTNIEEAETEANAEVDVPVSPEGLIVPILDSIERREKVI